MAKRKLTREEWGRVFERLAQELLPPQHHVTIIGGVAMALEYNGRRTTDDADAIMAPEIAADVLEAAARIAPEFSLPSDWLNQNAREAGKIKEPQPDHPVFTSATLVLEAPSREHMLAMKVARLAGDTDREDAKVLLKPMLARCSDSEEIWTLIGGLIPVELHEQARYNLDIIWEELHERP